MTLTELKHQERMYHVVHAAYLKPFRIKSNFAREYCQEVAAAASIGLISTIESPMVYAHNWRITGTGLDYIRNRGTL